MENGIIEKIVGSEKYKHLDFSYLLEYADGSTAFLKELIINCIAVIRPNMEELHHSIIAGDKKAIQFEAHKLKGTFAIIGSRGLNSLILMIETMAAANNDTNVATLYDEIKALYADVENTLEELLNELNADKQ